jgi:hypothetical protein
MTLLHDPAKLHWAFHPPATEERKARLNRSDPPHVTKSEPVNGVQPTATVERAKPFPAVYLLESLTGKGYVSRRLICVPDLYLARVFLTAEEAESFRLHHMNSPEDYAVCTLPEAGR